MSLSSLTLRAKKSISGLFTFSQLDTGPGGLVGPAQEAQRDKEKDAPTLEEFGSKMQHTELACPDDKVASPSKSLSTRRQRLMGSLRRISSLRSVRSSSSRGREPDESPSPSPETPRTPTRYVRHSLALNFTESPPGQPIFDLTTPRRSISSSAIVHHSSPLAIPSSKCNTSARAPVDPAVLPAGTIPTTPGPFQTAFERDAADTTPSPVLSPALERDVKAEPIPTPMPGTNLTFEDIHPDIILGPSSARLVREPSSYFEMPLGARHEEVEFDKSRYDDETARRVSAEALKTLVGHVSTSCETRDTERKPTVSKEKNLKYPRADGTEIECPGTASMAGCSEGHIEGIEHVVWEDEAVEGSPEDIPYASTSGDMIAGGYIEDGGAKPENTVQDWPAHSGLYDGSGYGGEMDSTISRPSTSTYETVETRPTSEDTGSLGAAKGKDCACATSGTARDSQMASLNALPDHETLEEVIRAYAVYEGSEAACTTDSDIAEDVELANRMMNNGLGA